MAAAQTMGLSAEQGKRLALATTRPGIPDHAHTACLKKFLNFVGQSVDPEGRFLHEMRRAMNTADRKSVV